MFVKATKKSKNLRLAVIGPSGSGKTYSALSIASGLGNRIAVIDTEHGSASSYSDEFEFDVVEMAKPFHPDNFIKIITAAEDENYDVLVIDSLTHAWSGAGGVTEFVDKLANTKFKGNSFAAWSQGTPLQNKLIEKIVSSRLHIICTMRSKQEYLQTQRNGKAIIQKVGLAPDQRKGIEYEFDVVLEMDMNHNAIVNKSRCKLLTTDSVFEKPNGNISEILKTWLSGVRRFYGDGSVLNESNAAEVAAYVEFMTAREIEPLNVDELRNWKQQSAKPKTAPLAENSPAPEPVA